MRALFLLLAGCQACAGIFQGYRNQVDYIEFEASVRIFVECPNGTQAGSGVAVSRRHVITAKHVVECLVGLPTSIVARTRHSATLEMAVDEVSETQDVARLVVVGAGEPFYVYAEISYSRPRVGDKVCSVGGDGPYTHSVRKCADIATVTDHYLVAPLGPVPGNSGSGVFDSRGRVVGILTRGIWFPDKEKLSLSVRSSAWKELAPPFEVEL